MPQVTYPNQRMVRIHREAVEKDFLGIKNENWQAAAKDLRPHAFVLYLYFASNANNYNLAFSPADLQQVTGMPRSTCRDQIQKLIDRGYLVLNHGNTYDFYEVPQPRAAQAIAEKCAAHVEPFNWDTDDVSSKTAVANNIQSESIEINNSVKPDNTINSDLPVDYSYLIPKVKEVVIPRPEATGSKRHTLVKPEPKKPVSFEF